MRSSFKQTYVCFKCMRSVRDVVDRTCPDCRKPMDSLFYKIRIPVTVRYDEGKWKAFHNGDELELRVVYQYEKKKIQ